MDVVFLVDYTGSMGGSINNVKTQITTIANAINTESKGNYRLGLTIFDEYNYNAGSNYSNKEAYTTLPASQRFINQN